MDKLKTPYELFYIECGEGWESLYKPLIEYIENYNLDHEDKIEITQIKEKFGGLRFYVDSYTEELKKLIDKAEEESYKTCEFCGTKNNVGLTINGWYTTICLDCLQKMLKEQTWFKFKIWRRKSDNKVFKVTSKTIEQIEQ